MSYVPSFDIILQAATEHNKNVVGNDSGKLFEIVV